jgi:hypothetical protein
MGFCRAGALLHAEKTGNRAFLNIKSTKIQVREREREKRTDTELSE